MKHKTDWKLKDKVTPEDMNRIASNISELSEDKINLYVGETLPEIRDRSKQTLYFKVTDTISASNTTENIKVSPTMGIKLVN